MFRPSIGYNPPSFGLPASLPNIAMKQYQDLIQDVLTNGSWQDNRTGIRTLSIPGAMMRFDLQKGFPAVTTKRLAFKSVVGELCVGCTRHPCSPRHRRRHRGALA